MKDWIGRIRAVFSRRTLGKDITAGVVLGVESVPDGLASGLLAGVNPLAGLYSYLFGMLGAAVFTGSTFMAVQATGAMALVVGDAGLDARPDPDRALFTLSVLTGVILVIAGALNVGRVVRFVPTSVMTGFLTAVGVNIVLGQLSNITGYDARGANRVLRSLDTVLNIAHWSLPAVIIGAITVLVILVFLPTRFGSLGLVVAVVVGSGAAALLNLWVGDPVVILRDLVAVPAGLPAPVLPVWSDIPVLLVPAISLALVCVVQGAGVSAGLPSPDGRRRADPSRDVIGQGVGNLVSGLFQGMPVGGSMSASSLLVQAGARTRLSVFVSAAVMAVVILFGSGLVAHTAMPALAGLLIVVGVSSIRPAKIVSVARTGPLPTTIMAVTFALTLVIPLQFSVLVGAGLGIVLYVARQSNRVRLRQLHLSANGRMRESDPDRVVAPGTVVVLQPYGSLFFASAPVFEKLLPEVDADSHGAVVVLRLRGIDELGLATIDVLARYAARLHDADSILKIVADDARVLTQIEAAGLDRVIGAHNLYRGGEWVGRALRRATADARAEVRPPG